MSSPRQLGPAGRFAKAWISSKLTPLLISGALLVGARTIRLDTAAPPVEIVPSASTRVLHGGRMNIDYIGPAGSFGPVTYSLADVVAGRVPAEKFRGKCVLIGATAASLGERVASPFVRYTDASADQHGALMPGVEVMANAIHVILSARYYTEPSDLAAFLWGARRPPAIAATDPAGRRSRRPPGRPSGEDTAVSGETPGSSPQRSAPPFPSARPDAS